MNELQILTFFSNSERTLIIDLLEKHLNELVETLSRDGLSEATVPTREQILESDCTAGKVAPCFGGVRRVSDPAFGA